MEQNACPRCGRSINDPNVRFCAGCGQELHVIREDVGLNFLQPGQVVEPKTIGPWDSKPIFGYGKVSAERLIGTTKVKGKLELVESGLQFTADYVLQVPFMQMTKAYILNFVAAFAVDDRSGSQYVFVVYGAAGYVRTINKRLSALFGL
jgi:hypothetical protein